MEKTLGAYSRIAWSLMRLLKLRTTKHPTILKQGWLAVVLEMRLMQLQGCSIAGSTV